MVSDLLRLLKRDPDLDDFANYIYDYEDSWLLEFLSLYDIAYSSKCRVYDKFGKFKYEEMYIWSVEPTNEIVDFFDEGNIPNKDEILSTFRKEFVNETEWVVKGLSKNRKVYRVINVPKEIKNIVKDLLVKEVVDYDLEYVKCPNYQPDTRYVTKIDDKIIQKIKLDENMKNLKCPVDKKYHGLYEYYLLFY